MFRKVIEFWDSTTFYLNSVVYYAGFGAAVVFVLSYFVPLLFNIAILILLFVVSIVFIEAILLYRKKDGIEAQRLVNERLSNGDENRVVIELQNNYEFTVLCTIIDELPFQFQERKWSHQLGIHSLQRTDLEYFLKPQERGEYYFGNINIYVQGP